MQLYLVRHGDAVSTGVDSTRPLSIIGRKQVLASAAYLLDQPVSIHKIYHSGVLRAQQTAEILAKALNLEIEKLGGVKSEDEVEPCLAMLETWTQPSLIVSHFPFLPRLIKALSGEEIQLCTADCVCLFKQKKHWQVEEVFRAPS